MNRLENKDLLKKYIEIYTSDEGTRNDELEVVFGSRYDKITRIKFENVISRLKSLGFTSNNSSGNYHLNIQSQFINERTGKSNMSNIRTTIAGLKTIQDYCNADTIDNPRDCTFIQKTIKIHNDDRLYPIDYNDFGFRINYKTEKNLKPEFGIVKDMLEKWQNQKKIFRLIKRFTYTHPDYPIKVDLSVVRSSNKTNGRMIPEYRVENSNVFNNSESYEIEIEVDKTHERYPIIITPDNKKNAESYLLYVIKKCIKLILSGIQESNFPISINEQDAVLDNYMSILYNKNQPDRRIRTKDFVGPSSVSLELKNIIPLSEDVSIPNIRTSYTVTEKADGYRKLLFISKNGKIYLIDTNMRVQFTGVKTDTKNYFNTIIDGEHVLKDKNQNFINNYLAFDIYYINKVDLRHNGFYIDSDDNDKQGRLIELKKLIKEINFMPFVGDVLPLKIKSKRFLYSDEKNGAIFQNCKNILERINSSQFEYETDGLIFTPADKGVASDKMGEMLDPIKKTWFSSLKWKPSHLNTIDFLVTTLKTEAKQDVIKNIFESGDNVGSESNIKEYKVLQLRVGFDENRDGYLNPAEDVIQDNVTRNNYSEDRSSYKPVPFYPTNPTPPYPAYLCNIMLKKIGSQKFITTENQKEIIEDETIVEFRYEQTAEKLWQWIPIKVRYDKTAEYRNGGRNYGNSYNTAQGVWNSIHHPVTEEMLMLGENIPKELTDSNVYYNNLNNKETTTKGLRDFHNLYVKRLLITAVSKKGNNLIDMTVGKGGDFPKWIGSKLSFVFGLDLSRDNIENRLNGAYARYLNYRKTYKFMPYALFVNANSSLNIKSGEACLNEKGKQITRAVFGDGPKDEKILGKGVYRQYGVGKDGFDIVSNQFSIHYFFENVITLNNFLRNVSECCKVGGYFIGSSYDGKAIYNLLKDKNEGETISILDNNKNKMWEIKKQYTNVDEDLKDNDTSIGKKIEVYQESINKVFAEYLVNYDYLTRLIENYGFTLVKKDEAKQLGVPSSIGNFKDLHNNMINDIKLRKYSKKALGNANTMTLNEKKISFLNNYFIFKKVRDVNAENVCRDMIQLSSEETKDNVGSILPSAKIVKPRIKKLGKIILKTKPEESAATEMLKESLEESKKQMEETTATALPVSTAPGSIKPKIIKTKKFKKFKLKKPSKTNTAEST